MPNWTYNDVTVKGPKKLIDGFYKKYILKDNGEMGFDFKKVVPEPESKDVCPSKYICDCKAEHIEDTRGGNWFNWYKYHNEKWGTKWNACDVQVTKSDNEIVISFSTAWAAPLPIFKELKKQNPNLKFDFDYVDEGDML